MYTNWGFVKAYQDLRHRELLEDAEKHMLVQEARGRNGVAILPLCRALTWLGRHLVTWGQGLQERYSYPVTTRNLNATGHAE